MCSIAIAKSFGRLNNYKIDPNQELIAIGVANTIGTLFNAYPATGSFSRSAIKAKAGVRVSIAFHAHDVVLTDASAARLPSPGGSPELLLLSPSMPSLALSTVNTAPLPLLSVATTDWLSQGSRTRASRRLSSMLFST
jgi:hypothetical protein